MLDGGLCWRLDRDKQQVEDKQRKKELALNKKQAAFHNPALLTAQVELPGMCCMIISCMHHQVLAVGLILTNLVDCRNLALSHVRYRSHKA